MRLFVGIIGALLLVSSCGVVGSINGSSSKPANLTLETSKAKSYDKIIPKEAISQKGLFTVLRFPIVY